MKKKEFIKRVAERADEFSESHMTIKDATVFYEAMMDVMMEMIRDEDEEKIPLQGIGTLMGITKKAHVYHDIVKKENLMAPAKKKMKFIPSGTFIDVLNSDE